MSSTQKIRFHLDESVNLAIARALRQRGIEVSTTPEANLLSASDEEQLAFAHSNGFVIVAHDHDFTVLHADATPHSGICYCHQEKYSVGQLLQALLLVHDIITPEDMENHLEFL